MKIRYLSIAISFCLLSSGCSFVVETSKRIWGSSTKALEKAQVDGITKDIQCSFDQCYEAILSLDRKHFDGRTIEAGFFDVFIKDPVNAHIVVMGIEGNVKTTKVGIFFSRHSQGVLTINVSSLSSSAKRKVAEVVFKELKFRFKEI